jgi:DNA-dependent protein kinase catalytic subunit
MFSGSSTGGKYLSSNYLAGSSLSQDIMLTNPAFFAKEAQGSPNPLERVRSDNKEQKHENSSLSLDKDSIFDSKEEKTDLKEDKIAELSYSISRSLVEDDILSTNSCMVSILALLDHMKQEFGKNWTEDKMPDWMKNMLEKLAHDSTHLHVKWFIAKVVVNRPEIFQPYAKSWFTPLIALCVLDNNGGRGFHYFLRDISFVVLTWNYVPEDDIIQRDFASRFVAHLMKSDFFSSSSFFSFPSGAI